MEKRAFTRQVLHHPAQYSSPQQNPAPCILKDFCKTGLFVAFENTGVSNQHHLNINDTLFIDFKSSGALQLNYRLHVRVARLVEGALGLEITHSNPEAIHALYKLSKEPAATQPRRPSNSNYEHVHGKCKQLVEAFAASTSRHLYSKINEVLIEKAEHATDNAHETAFIDAASRFKKYQDRIHRGFHSGLMKQVENWLEGVPVTLPEAMQPEKSAGLALVDKDDFEDWLLVKVIINKADQHYKDTLYDLQLRMSEMTGTEVNHKNNPLNPAYVSHAFYQAISPLQLTRELMQAVLAGFEAQVIVDGLARLYATLNQLFIDNDILSTITYQAVKSETTETASTHLENTEEPTEPQEPTSGRGSAAAPISGPGNENTTQDAQKPAPQSSTRTLSTVQSMLALRHRTPNTQAQTTASGEPAQLVATDKLVSQLNLFQSQPAAEGNEIPQSLSERIYEWCGEGQQLSEQDNIALEVTEKFFDSMGDNRYLSSEIKPVFKQLEVPMLKIFIQDESFFEDANHPARQVLNRLARLGSSGSQLSQKNSQRVENAIQKINEEFEDDPKVFNEAAGELDELITRQEASTQRNTERLVKSCDGLETIEKGKYTIRRFIEEQLSGKIVPKALIDLVNHGWRELLVFTLLRDGQDSAIWNSYANVVKSLGQIDPQADFDALHQLGTGLLKIIEIGRAHV